MCLLLFFSFLPIDSRMPFRTLLYAIVLFLVLSFFPIADALAVFENTKTNVLILFADDLGSGDLGMHGGVCHTPNIDRLASEWS